MAHHKGELLTAREAITTTAIGLLTGAFYFSAVIFPETTPLVSGTTQLLEKFHLPQELIKSLYAAELLTSLVLADQGRKRIHGLGIDNRDYVHYQASLLALRLRRKIPDKKDLEPKKILYHLLPRLTPITPQNN